MPAIQLSPNFSYISPSILSLPVPQKLNSLSRPKGKLGLQGGPTKNYATAEVSINCIKSYVLLVKHANYYYY